MKTIFIHTEPANADRVNGIANNLKSAEDKIEKGTAEAAVLVKKDDKGNVVGEYEAVVSAGLPKVQEIVGGYKKYDIMTHVVGAVDPAFAAEQAKLKSAESKVPREAPAGE